MSTRGRPLSKNEIVRAFTGPIGERYGPILSTSELAELLRRSPKTIYEWAAKGRLDGAYRKRGKGMLTWRDRAIEIIFNGTEWTNEE